MNETATERQENAGRVDAASIEASTVAGDRRRAAVLAALAALVYLATLSRNFSGDTIRYAVKAETQGMLAGIDLYHLFNQPLAWLAWQAARLTGWQERALVPIQVPNAVAGGAAVGLMFLLGRRLGLSARAATVAAAGLGVSCAMWLLATDGEYVTPGLALGLLPLVLWYGAPAATLDRPSFALTLGGALALAGLAFQTNLLLVPVLLWALAKRRELPAARRRRAAGLLLAAAAGLYAAGYGLGLAATLGPQGLLDWRPHPGMGLGYGLPGWSSLPHGAYALVRGLVGFPGLSLSDSTRGLWAAAGPAWRAGFAAWYAVAALLFAAPLAMGLRTLRREGAGSRVWVPLLLWALLSAAFAVYWVPGDLSFWVVVLVPWWLLAGRQLGDRRLGPALVALLGLVNAGALVLPNHDGARNAAYVEASHLAQAMAPGDLLMVPTEGRLQIYTYYLTRGAVLVPGAGTDALPATERVVASIDSALNRTDRRGGRLLVYGWGSGAWDAEPGVGENYTVLQDYGLKQIESKSNGLVHEIIR